MRRGCGKINSNYILDGKNNPVTRKWRLARWLLVILWIAAVFHFSGQSFAQQDLSPYIKSYPSLITAVQKLPPIHFAYGKEIIDNKTKPISFIQFVIRKTAHLTIYGFLGISVFFALQSLFNLFLLNWGLAAAVVAVISMLDEYQQTFIPSRTGRWGDVFIDLTGYLLLSIFVFIIELLYKKLIRKDTFSDV